MTAITEVHESYPVNKETNERRYYYAECQHCSWYISGDDMEYVEALTKRHTGSYLFAVPSHEVKIRMVLDCEINSIGGERE